MAENRWYVIKAVSGREDRALQNIQIRVGQAGLEELLDDPDPSSASQISSVVRKHYHTNCIRHLCPYESTAKDFEVIRDVDGNGFLVQTQRS